VSDRALACEVRRLGIEYLVCDSVGAATAGPPEAAEHALAYWRGVRQLGVRGSLHLAHVNKSETGDQKPFGSIFWHNQSRLSWFVKREAAGAACRVRLQNRKTNLTAVLPDVGFQFEFGAERTSVSRVAVNGADRAVEIDSISTRDRIVRLIREGGGQALTVAAIAEALQAKPESVGRLLRRNRDLFVTLPTGHVGLIARRPE
jgi:hypothetical protein